MCQIPRTGNPYSGKTLLLSKLDVYRRRDGGVPRLAGPPARERRPQLSRLRDLVRRKRRSSRLWLTDPRRPPGAAVHHLIANCGDEPKAVVVRPGSGDAFQLASDGEERGRRRRLGCGSTWSRSAAYIAASAGASCATHGRIVTSADTPGRYRRRRRRQTVLDPTRDETVARVNRTTRRRGDRATETASVASLEAAEGGHE